MNLGSAIRLVRKEVGVTQAELAERSKLSQTSLSQIETGTKNPSTRTIKRICNALDVPESLVYILGMNDTDVPESKQHMYKMLFPSIKSLALQIISTEEFEPALAG